MNNAVRQSSCATIAATPVKTERAATWVIINRQSSPSNRKKDADKRAAIEKTRGQSGVPDAEPIYRNFVGPGSLSILFECHFFDAVNPRAALPEKCVFTEMIDFFEELLRDRPGQRHSIESFVWSRIFRPIGFDRRKQITTGITTKNDIELFKKMLRFVLGSDAAYFEIQAHNEGTPGYVHGLLSTLGQKRGKGGRPKKSISRDEAKQKALELVAASSPRMRSPQFRSLLLEQFNIKIAPATAKRWLNVAGLESPAGRPRLIR